MAKDRSYKVLTGLYFLIIIALLVLISISIVGITFGKIDGLNVANIQNNVFALILAGVTITLASSIILPKFLIEQSVRDEIEKRSKTIEERLEQKYGTHINTTDAHLSRMIGYLLSKDNSLKLKFDDTDLSELLHDYNWSAGWALRSFKNYLRVSTKKSVMGEAVNATNYSDLIQITINLVSVATVKIFESTGYADFEKFSKEEIQALIPLFESDNIEDNWVSVHKRSVKEAFDIEYMYETNYDDYTSDMIKLARSFFKAITPLTLFSILLLIENARMTRAHFDPRDIADEIVDKSNFETDKGYRQIVRKIFLEAENLISINADRLETEQAERIFVMA